MLRIYIPLLLAALVVVSACNLKSSSGIGDANVHQEGDRIFIVDRTGKRWDVTHAVREYGFVAREFQFGLGPTAIPPILNPTHLSPGDPGYPADQATFLTMGTEINGDARGYPLSVMSRHEVVDERFGDAHVAVAY